MLGNDGDLNLEGPRVPCPSGTYGAGTSLQTDTCSGLCKEGFNGLKSTTPHTTEQCAGQCPQG